jgi:hypothetical protein
MSELIRLDTLVADAEAAADKGLKPEQCLHRYEPNLHCIWKTYYFKRQQKNEEAACAT